VFEPKCKSEIGPNSQENDKSFSHFYFFGEFILDLDLNLIGTNLFLNDQKIRQDSNPKIRDLTQHYWDSDCTLQQAHPHSG
jgi:hypothetical protein